MLLNFGVEKTTENTVISQETNTGIIEHINPNFSLWAENH